jgi:hypothetical protein
MKPFEACLFKRGYDTEAEALQNGMEVYFCLYCCKFHSRMSLANKRKENRFAHRERFFACAKRRRAAS